jgi:cell cycle checkpoint protein
VAHHLSSLKDKDSITDVMMKTLELEPITDFQFHGRDITVTNKVIVKSSWLKEAFNELDWSSSEVNFLLSPDAPYFRLTTEGDLGSCQVDCPKDSEVFELFECRQTQANRYKLKTLQPSVKALNLATKTQVRMNSRGTLSLQHLLKTEDGHSCFVEFYMLASDDDDDEQGDTQ